MCSVIKTEQRALLAEESELAMERKHEAGPSGAGQDVRQRSTTVYTTIKPGDKGLAVPYPNKFCCFWHTNGIKCEDLDSNGVCRFIDKHDTCGKRIIDPTDPTKHVKCKGKHRAINCPEPC